VNRPLVKTSFFEDTYVRRFPPVDQPAPWVSLLEEPLRCSGLESCSKWPVTGVKVSVV